MTEHHEGLRLIHQSASAEETGAIVAALEHFRRATAAPVATVAAAPHEWARAAILEGVTRDPELAFPPSG